MAWEPIDFDPFAEPQSRPPQPSAAPVEPPTREPSWLARTATGISNAFTGADRTEFPDAPEFLQAYGTRPMQRDASGRPATTDLGSVMRSAVSPDPEAQWDILSRNIDGLERKFDKHGNMMLKAPGMSDFAYLNKPGMSNRDLDEFGTQTLATLPLTALAAPARAAGVVSNMARGALGLTGASVAQDVAAEQMGSEQGIDSERAAISGGLGAALPAAGAVARGVGGAVMATGRALGDQVQAATNPKAVAERVVHRAFSRDKAAGFDPTRSMSQADQPSVAKFGQDARTMDFGGENVAGEARKAANFSAAARDELMRVIGPRFKGQASRLVNWFSNEGLGGSSQQMRDQLKAQARKARDPLYRQAYGLGKDGVNSPLLQQMQNSSPIFKRAMKAAEGRVADQAATPGWVSTGVRGKNGFTLEYWDQVKQTLDDYAGQAFRNGQNARGAQLSMMAKALRDDLDAQGQMGKLYSQARGTAMRFFKADDAIEAGQNFANGKFNFQDAQYAISQLNAAEKKLFTEGFADKFVQKVRSDPNRSNLLNRINSSDMEKDRLKLALGAGRYQQLESLLRLEDIMDKMRNAMGNSTTARQLTDLAKGYGIQGLGGGIGVYGASTGDPSTAIFGAIMAGGRVGQLRINENVAQEIGKLLTSKDPDVFLQGLQQLGKTPISDALRYFDNMLAEAGIATPIATQTGVNTQSYQPVLAPEFE